MISFENVSFTYSAAEDRGGIHNLNLTIKSGECVLFCGRSGCGKTTAIRMVNGLIPYFYPGELSGQVKIDGKSVSKLPMHRIAELAGSVFQNPRNQFFNVDTDSEIVFGLENRGEPQEVLQRKLNQTVEELGLLQLKNRSIFSLSGGEKQKIAFASVYAMNPSVYVLDEPSSNLDARAVEELRQHLQTVKQQGKTILIAEHRLYYLMELVDRIIYFEQGRVEGIYTPRELRALPALVREGMGLRGTELSGTARPAMGHNITRPLLEVRQMGLQYKKMPMLEGVSFQASAGEVIGIVGPNGAGKTSFCRALCGLHREHTGAVFWEGKLQRPQDRRRNSYLVMQDVNYQLFVESVEKECGFGINHPDRELILETMKELGLLPYRDRHPNTLSGGQKQRTAVAVSMVCSRKVLVFDEPTSGLDFDSMMQVSGLIRRLADQGRIIFLVTHDYEFLCLTCSRILHFSEKKLMDDFPVSKKNFKKLEQLFQPQLGAGLEEKEGVS